MDRTADIIINFESFFTDTFYRLTVVDFGVFIIIKSLDRYVAFMTGTVS